MAVFIDRVMFNILVKDLTTSAAFYRQLADFEQTYTSDWYIVMTAPGLAGLEIGLIDQVSEFAPRPAGGMPAGGFLTLVVDDVFAAYRRAGELGVEQIEPPTAQPYGQTRALIRDPNGVVIDLSTPTDALADRLGRSATPDLEYPPVDQQ